MKWHRLWVIAALALVGTTGVSVAQEEVVVSTYDGPPYALNQTETLSGSCEGKPVEMRFVMASSKVPGKLLWVADGALVADLSETTLGRDWTSPSLLTRKTLACGNGVVSLSAVGVEMAISGAVRHISTWAYLKDGAVTRYGPVIDIDPVVVSHRVRQ